MCTYVWKKDRDVKSARTTVGSTDLRYGLQEVCGDSTRHERRAGNSDWDQTKTSKTGRPVTCVPVHVHVVSGSTRFRRPLLYMYMYLTVLIPRSARSTYTGSASYRYYILVVHVVVRIACAAPCRRIARAPPRCARSLAGAAAVPLAHAPGLPAVNHAPHAWPL
eukprot:COSAG05_NODE_1520_length_4645_cov_613.938187_2_plen_164_part_00